jgi:hypothetical protein
MINLGTTGGSWSKAYGIKKKGYVVGSSMTSVATYVATVWRNNGTAVAGRRARAAARCS